MRSALRLDDAALRAWPLPPIDPEADKEARGRVVIIAGSREIPGAAILAAQAALRAGAGKVLIGTAASVAMPIAVAVPELRVIGLPETPAGGLEPGAASRLTKALDGARVVLIGPGLQDEVAATALAAAMRQRAPAVPMVLDACAMGAALAHAFRGVGEPVLVTPHAGEMAHLTGQSKASVLADPHGTALDAARRWNAVVALKGSTTVIARPDGQAWVHEASIAGLATAGSGDVLAGLIAGFAARGVPLEQAAAWAVMAHACAGARLAVRFGQVGSLARELAEEVPGALQVLLEDEKTPATRRSAPSAMPAPSQPALRR